MPWRHPSLFFTCTSREISCPLKDDRCEGTGGSVGPCEVWSRKRRPTESFRLRQRGEHAHVYSPVCTREIHSASREGDAPSASKRRPSQRWEVWCHRETHKVKEDGQSTPCVCIEYVIHEYLRCGLNVGPYPWPWTDIIIDIKMT